MTCLSTNDRSALLPDTFKKRFGLNTFIKRTVLLMFETGVHGGRTASLVFLF